MSREGVEVVATLGYPAATMHNALTTIHHDNSTHAVSLSDDGVEVGASAECVRGLSYSNKACALINEAIQLLHAEFAPLIKGQEAQLGTVAHSGQLPRHDVGVVLHLAHDDVVTRPQEALTPGVGNEVDARRGTRSKYHLLAVLCAYEPAYTLARLLVHIGHTTREVVHTAVDIGVVVAHKFIDLLDYRRGLLCRSARVKVDQGAVVDRAREDGEVCAYLLNVERHNL